MPNRPANFFTFYFIYIFFTNLFTLLSRFSQVSIDKPNNAKLPAVNRDITPMNIKILKKLFNHEKKKVF